MRAQTTKHERTTQTIINLNNGDHVVADLVELNTDRVKVYCRYMADAVAVSLFLNNCGVIEYENAMDTGVYLTILLDDVFSMTRKAED